MGQGAFNHPGARPKLDLWTLIKGSSGPQEVISYKNLVFPSLFQKTWKTRFSMSSETVKGTPDFCKKSLFVVQMTPISKSIGPILVSFRGD